MANRRHPELEGYESRQLYTFELKTQRKKWRDRMGWITSGLVLGISLGVGGHFIWLYLSQQMSGLTQAEQRELTEFRQGTEKAMRAAEETQRAEFREDWVTVAMLWQGAIAHMQAVSSSDPNYALAQEKVQEYSRNLQYAQSNVETRQAIQPETLSHWTLGTDRGTVLALEGTPSRVMRYDTLCREVMYFGNNRVELKHGQVSSYDNIDGSLNVLPTEFVSSVITRGDRSFWTIGSSREDVFRIEGPPTRISGYESIGRETLYYGDNFIEIEDGLVTGYQNGDRTFQVAIAGTDSQLPGEASEGNQNVEQQFWSLGASRDELLRIQQGTPTHVSRNRDSCEEKISYGASTVELRHGVVTGYNNSGNNLRIR